MNHGHAWPGRAPEKSVRSPATATRDRSASGTRHHHAAGDRSQLNQRAATPRHTPWQPDTTQAAAATKVQSRCIWAALPS
jgi:hypothetical protein